VPGPRSTDGTDGKERPAVAAEHGPVLLYDGVCGLCNWTVRVVLRLDRRGRVRFAPLLGDYATQVLARHPETRGVDSLVLVEARPARTAAGVETDREEVRVKSDAVLRLAHHLGGVWRAAAVLALLPRPVRDWAYDRVARHRYALFGRLARRPDPPGGAERRFLS
jgi:predicted DCC family thiol-disulfide oxidoreductase YuxK